MLDQGKFQGAGENLLGKVNGNEFSLGAGIRFVMSPAEWGQGEDVARFPPSTQVSGSGIFAA
jgi:hypothetical protein